MSYPVLWMILTRMQLNLSLAVRPLWLILQKVVRWVLRALKRHDRLARDLERMQGLGPFSRAKFAARFTDTELAGRVWENYKPAMPVTFEGAIFAVVGFLGGLALFSFLIWLLRLPFSLFRRTTTP
jgi:hypothetical protein